MLPKHITLHIARMRLTQVEADSTLRIVQEIETESRKLADVDVDVIVFAATAPSSRNGIGYDRELVARIEAASRRRPPRPHCSKRCACFPSNESYLVPLGALQ